MKKFIPREKLSRKARKVLDAKQRVLWACPPETKKIESKKRYNRKRKPFDGDMDTVEGHCRFLGLTVEKLYGRNAYQFFQQA